jgi:phytoene dehydrogenase-like protein
VTEAVVVGSGPNGLAAAVTLAQAGVRVTVIEADDRIGGGTRSAELTLPGLLHDECSAFHPFGMASPYLRSLDLEAHGLRWAWPPLDLAHPLDDGSAGVLSRDMATTVASLGPDGPSWRRLFSPLVADFDAIAAEVLQPVAHLPRHPLPLVRFGLSAIQPATLLARRWRGERAKGLFGGSAAHQLHPLTGPFSAALGVTLSAAGHAYGWPVAVGGSRAITDALAGLLRAHGGTIETGVEVHSLAELKPAEIVLLDVAPGAAATIIGDRLPPRVARAYRRWRHGPSAYKLDLAVEGGIPWTNEQCRSAGTVHLGGTLAEMAATEQEVADGRMPRRPFVLIGQQYLADPGRSAGDLHPVWAYAHVPHGYTGDAQAAILDQIERFAPGTRERIRAQVVRTPADFAATNPNYVGGDIGTGANDPRQLLLRPRISVRPYWTGVPGVYLCSAATPPGAGVHGMCGHLAARSALRLLDQESSSGADWTADRTRQPGGNT